MPIDVRVLDGAGNVGALQMHERDDVRGAVAYTREYAEYEPLIFPLLNPIYGDAINQAAGFSGTPVLITNGGDSAGWTGAAGAGTWDFADTSNPFSGSACVSLTNGNNSDNATFTGSSVSGSSYVALSLQIRLDAFNATTTTIVLSLSLSGAPVGISVSINDYIDTSVLGVYQSAIIPLVDLSAAASTFDEITFTVLRTGGAKPIFRVDVFQVEESGEVIKFAYTPERGKNAFIDCIRYTFANNVTGAAAQEYNEILGLSLVNGILFVRTKKGDIVSSAVTRDMTDIFAAGGKVTNRETGAADSLISIDIPFSKPIRLESTFGDEISISISEDFSGYLTVKSTVIGWVEDAII